MLLLGAPPIEQKGKKILKVHIKLDWKPLRNPRDIQFVLPAELGRF